MGAGRRAAGVLLSCLFLSLLVYLLYNKIWLRQAAETPAALAVRSLSSEPLNVSLDGSFGKTPFRADDLPPGEKTLVLSDGKNSFRAKVSFLAGTMTVINWRLGPDILFSEGEILWLEKTKAGAPFLIISDPAGAEVRLDGVLLGATPLSSSEIAAGDYTLRVAKDGYRSREINIHLEEGYKLNIKVRLFLKPLEEESVKFLSFPEEPRISLVDFSSSREELSSDPVSWVKGLVYSFRWADEQEGGDLPKNYDYFVDYQGRLYNSEGVKMAAGSEGEKTLEKMTVGYLGEEAGELSEAAKSVLLSLGKSVFLKREEIEILPTGLGWLRVRDEPNLSGREVAKVDVGDKFGLLGESNGWYRIGLPDGKEGWLSAQYAKKL